MKTILTVEPMSVILKTDYDCSCGDICPDCVVFVDACECECGDCSCERCQLEAAELDEIQFNAEFDKVSAEFFKEKRKPRLDS